jgi:hypothetical protein
MPQDSDNSAPSPAPLARFSERYGLAGEKVAADSGELDILEEVVPRPLLEFWRLQGFGRYADGLIWTHNPASFQDVLTEWTNLPEREAVLIARFSFGDFCFWAEGRAYFADVHLGKATELARDIEFLFDYVLCRDQFLQDVLRLRLHQDCTTRLGRLRAEECFAFVPARALGGPCTPETVQRVALREHLALLAQLAGPIRIR